MKKTEQQTYEKHTVWIRHNAAYLTEVYGIMFNVPKLYRFGNSNQTKTAK